MAAYTSTQSGNWSDPATWGGSGTPGDGDTASIGAHTVTVDVTTTVGTSPNDNTTNAIVLTSASSILNVAAGVSLTVKGNIGHTNSATHRQQAGSTVTFDASASGGTPTYRFQNGGFSAFEFHGTSGSRATIQAATGRVASMAVPLRSVTATYTTFTRMGDIFTLNNSPGAATLQHCEFTGCGIVRLFSLSTTLSCVVEDNTFTGGTQTNDLILQWSSAKSSGTRSLRGNSCTGMVNYNSQDFACENNYIGGSIGGFAGRGYEFFRHNFIVGDQPNGQIIPSSVSRCYWYAEKNNPHYIDPRAAAADVSFDQNIFEQSYVGVTDVGDCLLVRGTPSTGGKIVGRNNIVLRNALDDASTGCLLTGYSLADGIVTEWYRNTGNVENSEAVGVGKRGMFAVAEGSDGFAGQVAVLKGNLAWATAASQGFLGERVQGNVKDIFTASGCDYNWRHNTSDGDNGRGYEDRVASNTLWTAGDATAAGVDANGGTGDPQFVDSTRNLSAWATARGYGSTTADGLIAIRADTSRIADLIAYVFEGFKPQNSLMRTAAHDGGVVGAANYHDSTRDTTILGFHGAIVADTYGIAYTGDLPDALVPPVLTATSAGTAITLEWTAATGGVESYTYDVYRDAVLLASNQSSPYVDTTATPGVTYTYVVRVTDAVDETADSNGAAEMASVSPERKRVWRSLSRNTAWKVR